MSTVVTQALPVSYPDARVQPSTAVGRLDFVDSYRGLLCLLMALDHAVYFLWSGAHEHSFTFWYGPFSSQESVGETIVRMLSNLSAPGFFLLLGAGLAFYVRARRKLGWTDQAISRHFVERGAVLVVLQFFVENPLWCLNPSSACMNYVGVLYALGAAMILASLVWRLPSYSLALLGAAAILLPEVLVKLLPLDGRDLPLGLALFVLPGQAAGLNVYFSCVPWFGMAAWGIVLGRALVQDQQRTLRLSAYAGLAMIAVGALLRIVGGFGNLGIVDGGDWRDAVSFVKYGPSATFVCWNVGVTLAALPLVARLTKRVRAVADNRLIANGPLIAYGRSALFFYVAHLLVFGLVAHAIGIEGLSFAGALIVWALALAWLWPACLLYGRFKAATGPNSLWRLF
jgi:uncharacterized membrane protein